MKTFKTPKGTVLPLLDLKGKDYLMVPYRIQWFREEHPDWYIETEFIKMENDFTIAKAVIHNEKGQIVSMAHKREDRQDFKDHLEKAESSAIGRALAFCGYGTQFAAELNEDERIADSPLEPAKKEIKNYAPQSAPIKTINDETPMPAHIDDSLIQVSKMKLSKYVIQFGKFKGKYLVTIPIYDAENYANYLETQARKDSKPLSKGAQEYIEMVGLYSKYSVNDEVPEVESIKIDEMPDFGGPTEEDEVPF